MGTLYYSPADQTETRAYRRPCGVAYTTPCADGTWYVHYEDKGGGYGRRMGCGLTPDEARRLAHRLAWEHLEESR